MRAHVKRGAAAIDDDGLARMAELSGGLADGFLGGAVAVDVLVEGNALQMHPGHMIAATRRLAAEADTRPDNSRKETKPCSSSSVRMARSRSVACIFTVMSERDKAMPR